MAFGEDLDDHHGRTATGTGAGVVARGIRHTILTDEAGLGNERGQRDRKQLPGARQIVDPGGIGEQAGVADAVEPGYALQRIKGFMRSTGLCGVTQSGAAPCSGSDPEYSA
jgi:hypothetical protein